MTPGVTAAALALSLLLPSRCTGCGAAGGDLCGICIGRLEPPPDLPCPDSLDLCVAVCLHAGTGRQVVHALKFRDGRGPVDLLGLAMARLVEASFDGPLHAVTGASTTPDRRRRRGYDQARLLAGATARHLGLPHAALLASEGRVPQAGLTRAARVERSAFRVTGRPPPAVLVVDDVRTTGATLAAAGSALRLAGVSTVVGVTFAATPLQPDHRSQCQDEDPERGGGPPPTISAHPGHPGVRWSGPDTSRPREGR